MEDPVERTWAFNPAATTTPAEFSADRRKVELAEHPVSEDQPTSRSMHTLLGQVPFGNGHTYYEIEIVGGEPKSGLLIGVAGRKPEEADTAPNNRNDVFGVWSNGIINCGPQIRFFGPKGDRSAGKRLVYGVLYNKKFGRLSFTINNEEKLVMRKDFTKYRKDLYLFVYARDGQIKINCALSNGSSALEDAALSHVIKAYRRSDINFKEAMLRTLPILMQNKIRWLASKSTRFSAPEHCESRGDEPTERVDSLAIELLQVIE